MHMQQYNSELALSRDEFLTIDEDIKRARDNMQLWQEKEAALMPANFSPDSPFGTYGKILKTSFNKVLSGNNYAGSAKKGMRIFIRYESN